jgi:hypothetical protein
MGMGSVDAQRLMMADRLHDQPDRFAQEDLVHLQALLDDTSPRQRPPRRLSIEDDQGAREPETAAVQKREEKQRERYRKRYHNRIVRASLFQFEADVQPRASLT